MFSRGLLYLFISFLLSFIKTLVVEKAIDELNAASKRRREQNRNNTAPSES